MASTGLVFAGIRGSVVALDRATGTQVWTTRLKGSDFVNVALLGEDLYASARGEIYCLDPSTGAVRWHNPLKGLGYGLVSIATDTGRSNQAPSMRKRKQEEAATAAAAASAAS